MSRVQCMYAETKFASKRSVTDLLLIKYYKIGACSDSNKQAIS